MLQQNNVQGVFDWFPKATSDCVLGFKKTGSLQLLKETNTISF